MELAPSPLLPERLDLTSSASPFPGGGRSSVSHLRIPQTYFDDHLDVSTLGFSKLRKYSYYGERQQRPRIPGCVRYGHCSRDNSSLYTPMDQSSDSTKGWNRRLGCSHLSGKSLFLHFLLPTVDSMYEMEGCNVRIQIQILVFGSISMMGTAVHYGLGRHTQYLTEYQAHQALKFLWVGFNITPSAEATAKISITIMLMRITTSKRWKWFFSTLIVLIILITIASLLTILLSCHPIELLWDPSISGSCNAYERTVDIYIQGGKS